MKNLFHLLYLWSVVSQFCCQKEVALMSTDYTPVCGCLTKSHTHSRLSKTLKNGRRNCSMCRCQIKYTKHLIYSINRLCVGEGRGRCVGTCVCYILAPNAECLYMHSQTARDRGRMMNGYSSCWHIQTNVYCLPILNEGRGGEGEDGRSGRGEREGVFSDGFPVWGKGVRYFSVIYSF